VPTRAASAAARCDTGAGLQHDAGHAAHRDVGAHARHVHHHEGAVEHVDLAALDEDTDIRSLMGMGFSGGSIVSVGSPAARKALKR
jgi:hypothetical protein